MSEGPEVLGKAEHRKVSPLMGRPGRNRKGLGKRRWKKAVGRSRVGHVHARECKAREG